MSLIDTFLALFVSVLLILVIKGVRDVNRAVRLIKRQGQALDWLADKAREDVRAALTETREVQKRIDRNSGQIEAVMAAVEALRKEKGES